MNKNNGYGILMIIAFTIVFSLLFDSFALGIGIGIAIGLPLSTAINKRQASNNKKDEI